MVATRPDPLASLARLRRLETGAARRRVAGDTGRLHAAEARADAADAALRTEGDAAAPADYAAWLRSGIAERDRAALGAGHAAERLADSRSALAEARVAERCLEQFMRNRAAAARSRLLRKAQAATDDAAGRKAHGAAHARRG